MDPTPETVIKQSETRVSGIPLYPGLKPWQTGGLVLALALMAIAALAWTCTRDPKISFLSRDARAEWILFPRAMDASAHRALNLDTVFRREFALDAQPKEARLDFRAAKQVELKINGAPVEIAGASNWKDVVSVNVGAFLRPGQNSIEAKVFNDIAPPALWLTLTRGSTDIAERRDLGGILCRLGLASGRTRRKPKAARTRQSNGRRRGDVRRAAQRLVQVAHVCRNRSRSLPCRISLA